MFALNAKRVDIGQEIVLIEITDDDDFDQDQRPEVGPS